MDLTSIVEDTERTRFFPQTDRRMDWQGETSIPPFNYVEAGGIIMTISSGPVYTYRYWTSNWRSIHHLHSSFQFVFVLKYIYWRPQILLWTTLMVLLHKSYDAPVLYPTNYAPFCCTRVHISVTKWYIAGHLSDALWDFLDNSIMLWNWIMINISNRIFLSFISMQIFMNTLQRMWPSNAIWRHRTGSPLAQVMARCLKAPSHYLNQCWLIISKVQWNSSEGNIITSRVFAGRILLQDILTFRHNIQYITETALKFGNAQYIAYNDRTLPLLHPHDQSRVSTLHGTVRLLHSPSLGLDSQSGKTSYHQISWSLKAAWSDVIMIISLWNLTGISAALLPRCLSIVRAVGNLNMNLAASRRQEILR